MAKMIQLRHVPDSLHRQLKARAALSGLSLSEFLVREVRKIAERPTPEEEPPKSEAGVLGDAIESGSRAERKHPGDPTIV